MEYNTKPKGKCLQNYSSFKIKECLHIIKQKLPHDNLIAKSTVFYGIPENAARAPNDNL